jgi:hypothetical protein
VVFQASLRGAIAFFSILPGVETPGYFQVRLGRMRRVGRSFPLIPAHSSHHIESIHTLTIILDDHS